MPDFSALGKLFGGIKDVLDFVAGITGSVGGFNDPEKSFVGLAGELFGSAAAE